MNYPFLPHCDECDAPCDDKTVSHWTEGIRHDGYGHKGLCCDCFDETFKRDKDTEHGKSVDHHD